MEYFRNSIYVMIMLIISLEAARGTTSTKLPIPYYSSPLLSKVATVTPTTIHPSIRSLCLATKNTKKCLDLILPFVTGGAMDPVSILNMEMQSLYDITGQAMSFATRLSKEDPAVTSLEDKEILQFCVKHYGVAARELVKAAIALSTRDSKAVNSTLRATVSSFRRCDKAFGNRSGLLHDGVTIDEIDQLLLDMAKLCLEISMLIQKGTP